MGKLCEETWPNRRAPRVTHSMACGFSLWIQNFGGRGVRPHDLSSMQRLHNVPLTGIPPFDSYYEHGFEII
jgi:hypothetical protein